MRRPLLIAGAAATYLVAAWMVAPGFYDGIAPQQPYNWVCPPPVAGANSGIKAASGHLVVKVIDGISDPNSAFTDDGQVRDMSKKITETFVGARAIIPCFPQLAPRGIKASPRLCVAPPLTETFLSFPPATNPTD